MFKNCLNAKRMEKNLTITEFADKARIPSVVVSMIERGYIEPSDEVKTMLARALNVKVEHLFPPEVR